VVLGSGRLFETLRERFVLAVELLFCCCQVWYAGFCFCGFTGFLLCSFAAVCLVVLGVIFWRFRSNCDGAMASFVAIIGVSGP